jgi:phosphatidylserine synthase
MLEQRQEAPMADFDSTSSNPGPQAGNSGGTGASPGPGTSWRQQRRAERWARRADRHGDWGGLPIGGLIIIAVGLVFLAGNFGLHLPERWWAILILIPGAAALVSAVRFYRTDGKSPRVFGSAIGGLVMVSLALALFFGLNWGAFWPIILILVGAGIVARGYWQR